MKNVPHFYCLAQSAEKMKDCISLNSCETHQEYPLQLILNVLHARKRCHTLNHLHKDAPNTPETQTQTFSCY